MNIERWFSGLLALAAIGLLTLAWGYTAPIAYDPIGPRPYPMLILSLLALGCIYLVVRPSTLTHALNLGYTKAILKNIGLCMAFFIGLCAHFRAARLSAGHGADGVWRGQALWRQQQSLSDFRHRAGRAALCAV